MNPSSIVRLAERIASTGLGDFQPPTEVPDAWADPLLDTVEYQRLTGLAIAAVAKEQVLPPNPQWMRRLLNAHRAAMELSLRLESTLMRVGEGLANRGVRFLVLKGPAVARHAYPDPALRPFGDLDLLVAPDDWARAHETIEGAGFASFRPEPRPGFIDRFGSATLMTDLRDMKIDLHRRLMPGPFGQWIDHARLFDRSREDLLVGPGRFRRLDDTDMLLHAMAHAVLGASPPLLLPLRDVSQLVSIGDIDWDRLTRDAQSWRLAPVFASALRASSKMVGSPLDHEAAALCSVTAGKESMKALSAYTSSRRQRCGVARATVRAIPGLGAKVAYVWALLFPSRAFLRSRAESGGAGRYRDRWRRALAPGARQVHQLVGREGRHLG